MDCRLCRTEKRASSHEVSSLPFQLYSPGTRLFCSPWTTPGCGPRKWNHSKSDYVGHLKRFPSSSCRLAGNRAFYQRDKQLWYKDASGVRSSDPWHICSYLRIDEQSSNSRVGETNRFNIIEMSFCNFFPRKIRVFCIVIFPILDVKCDFC